MFSFVTSELNGLGAEQRRIAPDRIVRMRRRRAGDAQSSLDCGGENRVSTGSGNLKDIHHRDTEAQRNEYKSRKPQIASVTRVKDPFPQYSFRGLPSRW